MNTAMMTIVQTNGSGKSRTNRGENNAWWQHIFKLKAGVLNYLLKPRTGTVILRVIEPHFKTNPFKRQKCFFEVFSKM